MFSRLKPAAEFCCNNRKAANPVGWIADMSQFSSFNRTGEGDIFLLKSYNTRDHSVCGLAKLIWRASEDTKYMARKKGGTQLYGIVTALEKARRHRYDGGNRHQVPWG